MSQSVDRAYISVITTAPQQVQAYLYSTAEEVLRMSGSPRVAQDRTGIVLAVSDSRNVQFTAQYQADRLSSGLHGAKVHETFQDAASHLHSHLVAGKHTATGYTHPELLQAARTQTRAPQSNARTR